MTTAYRKLLERSQNCLRRILRKPAWDFNRFVADPRQQKGRRWKFPTLMRALLCGFLTNRGSLRAVESLTEWSFDQRLPDSTLDDLIGKFSGDEVADLRRQLHAPVRTDWRSKSLDPVGLPCGVVAVDNQTLGTGPVAHAHDPHAQVVHQQDRRAYAQVRAVRTVLLSAASTPAIDQAAIRANTHEGGMFPEVFRALEANDAALMEIDSVDAGFCSRATAPLIAEAHKGSIIGLTGNQPDLCREAERLLGARTQAACSREWEPSQGDQIRSHLYRTTAMAAYLDWSHLQQVWRVEKEIRQGKTGHVERENRDYLTNLHRGRLKSEQILAVVRAHWGIENHGHWTMDVIWDEDSKVWCGQGVGIQVLGLWRLMAYNLVSLWRCRYLRTREQTRAEKRRWQECCDLLFLLLSQVGRDLFPHRQATAGL
jgi:predicted transposase YbfD/YdcC